MTKAAAKRHMSEKERQLWEQALRAKNGGLAGRGTAGSAGTACASGPAEARAACAHADAGMPATARLRSPQAGPAGKGIGPNKACGHKGGISRQGSKRG